MNRDPDGGPGDADQRVARFQERLRRLRDDPAEAARIDALVMGTTLCSDPAPESCSDAGCPVHGWDNEDDYGEEEHR